MYGENLLKIVNWTINVPKKDEIADEFVSSTKFSVIFKGVPTEWHLVHNFNSKGYFNAFVCSMSGDNVNFNTFIKFIVLDRSDGSNTELHHKIQISEIEKNGKNAYTTNIYLGNQLLTHEEIYAKNSLYVKDGKLRLFAGFLEDLPLQEQANEPHLSVNLKKIEDIFSFMTSKSNMMEASITLITADGVELQAFKDILSKGSIVFQKMFEHDMIEKSKRVVKIIGFRAKVMEQLLKFLYFGKVDVSGDIDIELYNAAKIYQVEGLDGLQELCLKSIKSRISSSQNLIEILEFADTHNEQELYDRCLDCIAIVFDFLFPVREEIRKLSPKLQDRVFTDLSLIFRGDRFCQVEYAKV